MKKILLILSFFSAFTLSAQNQWNIVGESVRVSPDIVSDSTFVLSAPSRAALRQGQANWVPASSGGSASYLVYTALLTQSGTDAPVATVLENTLGGTVVWSYVDVGTYLGTLTGAFAGDIMCSPSLGIDNNGFGISKPYIVYKDSDNAIGVSTYSDYSGTGSNGVLSGTAYIEIRKYN